MLQRAEGEVKWQGLRFLLMFVMINEFQFESGKVFDKKFVSPMKLNRYSKSYVMER